MVDGTGQGYAKSKDGLELHMATNYLGPFLLTMLLLPSLQRSASKVTNSPMIMMIIITVTVVTILVMTTLSSSAHDELGTCSACKVSNPPAPLYHETLQPLR